MRLASLLVPSLWLAPGACAASTPVSRTASVPVVASASASAIVSGGGESPSNSKVAVAGSTTNRDGEVLPEGFVWADRERPVRCGEFVIEHGHEGGGDERTPVVLVKGPRDSLVYEQHGSPLGDGSDPDFRMWLFADYCGDLTGDGAPELVMTETGGGAGCCENSHVVSLTSPPRRILTLHKGGVSDRLLPVKYRPGAAWQLESKLQISVYPGPSYRGQKGPLFGGLMPYLVVPTVLSLHEGRYEVASLSFPEAFRRDRAAILAKCRGTVSCEGIVMAWLDSLILEDWKTERRDPAYEPWLPSLDRLAPRMQRELQAQLRREADRIH